MSLSVRYSNHYDYSFQLHIVGEIGVGKSAILDYLFDNESIQKLYHPNETKVRTHSTNINNQSVKLTITEQSSTPRNTAFLMIVCDITNINTFCNLDKWIQNNDSLRTKTIIIGNKSDLSAQREIDCQSALLHTTATIPGRIAYIETSAKTGKNIKSVFNTMIKTMRRLVDSTPKKLDSISPILWTKEECLVFGFCRKYEHEYILIPYDIIQMFLQFFFEPVIVANSNITFYDNYVPKVDENICDTNTNENDEDWEIIGNTSETHEKDDVDSMIESIYLLHLCSARGQIPNGMELYNDIFMISLNIFLYSNNEWSDSKCIKSREKIKITHHMKFIKEASKCFGIGATQSLLYGTCQAAKGVVMAPIEAAFMSFFISSDFVGCSRLLVWFGSFVVILPCVPILHGGVGFSEGFNHGLDLLNGAYSEWLRSCKKQKQYKKTRY